MTTSIDTMAGIVQPVQVHYDDLDAMGIVHNAKYAVLIERALSGFWMAEGWTFDPKTSRFPDDVMLAVREFAITYLVPIPAVSGAAVQLWIEQLGRTSIAYGFRVLSADHTLVHAEGRRVQVKVDPIARRPAPLSDEIRAAAQVLLAPAGS